MVTKAKSRLVLLMSILLVSIPVQIFSQPKMLSLLNKEFDFTGKRSQQTQYYIMRSELVNFSLTGKRLGREIYTLHLKVAYVKMTDTLKIETTCLKFTVQYNDSIEITIPSLQNWSYSFKPGLDRKNQVFGIDHAKFENLLDNNSNVIPTDKRYHIYNTFVDFHSFCDIFAEPTGEGKGMQDLHKIGQKIVHDAAFSRPPTNLGKNVAPGSFFQNGEITLELKGVSVVNNKPCALIGVDSGENSFKMILSPMPKLKVISVGGSHYWGEIYKDLVSNWVQKVAFHEIVVTETRMDLPPNKINSVVERHVIILNVNREKVSEFN